MASIGFTGQPLFDRATVDIGVFEEGLTYSLEVRLRNISGRGLELQSLVSSCGCTEVSTKSSIVEPDSDLDLLVNMDTSGKYGSFVKIVDINLRDEAEPFELKLTGTVLHSEKNSEPGALFRGKCASCHLPSSLEGKDASALYDSLCYICHKESVLDDVSALERRHVRSAIAEGVSGTSMPGFASKNNGPLSEDQIDLITDFIVQPK